MHVSRGREEVQHNGADACGSLHAEGEELRARRQLVQCMQSRALPSGASMYLLIPACTGSDTLNYNIARNFVSCRERRAQSATPVQKGKCAHRGAEARHEALCCRDTCDQATRLGNCARRVSLRQCDVCRGRGSNVAWDLYRGAVRVHQSGAEERCSLDADVDYLRGAGRGSTPCLHCKAIRRAIVTNNLALCHLH